MDNGGVDSLSELKSWPADNVAVAVIGDDGVVRATYGDQQRVFRLASVTKLLSAYAALVAIEEEAITWDQPAGPDGSTVRHLVAHASGLNFDSRSVVAPPGARRIYSNEGFAVLGETITESTGIGFAEYLAEAVCAPLGMSATRLDGTPGAGGFASCADLSLFAAELQAPKLISAETLMEATSVAFPGLTGILPGYGRQSPNDWGLGFEIRDHKEPHWTASSNSSRTFGHFGQSGTFLWVDPDARVSCVALTDRDFGKWAIERWPALSELVLRDHRSA